MATGRWGASGEVMLGCLLGASQGAARLSPQTPFHSWSHISECCAVLMSELGNRPTIFCWSDCLSACFQACDSSWLRNYPLLQYRYWPFFPVSFHKHILAWTRYSGLLRLKSLLKNQHIYFSLVSPSSATSVMGQHPMETLRRAGRAQ